MLLDFVSFDLETTGLDAASARVVEVAAVRFSGSRAVARYQSLVHPGEPIAPASTAIHGITDADVQGAPAFADAYAQFRGFAGALPLVAHNAPFDLGFLAAECGRAGLVAPAAPVLDTLVFARAAFPLFKSYRLQSLVGALSLGGEVFHRALADAESAGRLLLAALATGVQPPARAWVTPPAAPAMTLPLRAAR